MCCSIVMGLSVIESPLILNLWFLVAYMSFVMHLKMRSNFLYKTVVRN